MTFSFIGSLKTLILAISPSKALADKFITDALFYLIAITKRALSIMNSKDTNFKSESEKTYFKT